MVILLNYIYWKSNSLIQLISLFIQGSYKNKMPLKINQQEGFIVLIADINSFNCSLLKPQLDQYFHHVIFCAEKSKNLDAA